MTTPDALGNLPLVTRTYCNHHLDSSRWRHYQPRTGDIVVTTAYKAGTTWTQLIVLSLLQPELKELHNISMASPWPDRRFNESDDEIAERLAMRDPAQPLCLKSHLPLDGLPHYHNVRYVLVARDPRDVFMSLFNHYSNYSDGMYARLNDDSRVGDPLPRCPDDPRTLWKQWIARGWFEWEREGWPFWSNLGHTRSYWHFRHLPNILFVHYHDLWQDTHAQISRIATFIGADRSPENIDRVARTTQFDTVKKYAKRIMPQLDKSFRGGADAFFFKGGGGRWRDVLEPDDLELYDAAMAELLPSACARWLEHGGDVMATRDE